VAVFTSNDERRKGCLEVLRLLRRERHPPPNSGSLE
jgi:hypothetical protein